MEIIADKGTAFHSVLRSRVIYGSARTLPQADLFSDADGGKFYEKAVIGIAQMLELLQEQEPCDHLLVDVFSEFFEHHAQAAYVVAASVNGKKFGSHAFRRAFRRHQFIIPLCTLRQEQNEIALIAEPMTGSADNESEAPLFSVTLYLASKEKIESELEEGMIWLFSTARSGSSWLAFDVISANHRARPMNETGIGRIVAPIHWEAERFFDAAGRTRYAESGFSYEIGAARRSAEPMFFRTFRNMSLETQYLNQYNSEFYSNLIRHMVFEHLLREWGVIHYKRVIFKMPNDSHGADFIMRAFPKSHLVFLMRDGRDVLRSRFTPFASPTLAQTTDKELRRYAVAFYSHFWNFQVDIIRSAFEAHDEARRILVRYEDLRGNPKDHMAPLLKHLGMQLSEEEVDALVESSRLENQPLAERGPDKARQEGKIGGFREMFDEGEIALMNSIMGPNLRRYGYRVGSSED